jgi:hypothetical protein
MHRGILVAAVFAFVPACVTTQILAEESAGQVGCPPDEITISEKRDGAFNLVWKAQCRGTTYFCTFGDPTSCKEEAGGATPAPGTSQPSPRNDVPVAGSGCQYDTQCKGERICEAGTCVDPTTTRSVPTPEPAPTPAAKPEATTKPSPTVGPTPPPR